MSGKVIVFCEGRVRVIYQVKLMCDMFVGPFMITPHDHVTSTWAEQPSVDYQSVILLKLPAHRLVVGSNCGAFLDFWITLHNHFLLT